MGSVGLEKGRGMDRVNKNIIRAWKGNGWENLKVVERTEGVIRCMGFSEGSGKWDRIVFLRSEDVREVVEWQKGTIGRRLVLSTKGGLQRPLGGGSSGSKRLVLKRLGQGCMSGGEEKKGGKSCLGTLRLRLKKRN